MFLPLYGAVRPAAAGVIFAESGRYRCVQRGREDSMTIRHFQIFMTVAKNGSINRAAEELCVAQPTVSAVIRELEDHYGARFFDRTSQKLKITAEGKALMNYAGHLLSLYEDEGQTGRGSEAKGTLRVGASVNVGIYYLPALVKEFNRRFPNITVQVKVNTAEAVEQLLVENHVDLAVIGGEIQSEMIHATYLFVENHIAVCSPDHSLAERTVTLREFVEQPLLFRERSSGAFETFRLAIARAGCTAEPAWESASTEALLEAVRYGLGVTVLPERLAREEIQSGRLAQIYLSDFVFRNNVCLACHKNKYVSPVMKYFIDMAKKRVD